MSRFTGGGDGSPHTVKKGGRETVTTSQHAIFRRLRKISITGLPATIKCNFGVQCIVLGGQIHESSEKLHPDLEEMIARVETHHRRITACGVEPEV